MNSTRQSCSHARPRARGSSSCSRWLICSSSVPAPNTLRATSLRSSVVVCRQRARCRGRTRRALRIQADAAAFLASMEDREAKGPPSLSQTVRRPSAFRASGAGSGTANSAAASGCGGSQVFRRCRPIVWGISAMRLCRGSSTAGMQSQRYASYFRKPRPSACRTWRSPLIRTTSRHSASSKQMAGSWSSPSSNRSSSAASLACAFASCAHNGV